MLTATPGERSAVRRQVLRQAWAPCARGLPLPTLAALGALAAVPTLVVVVRRGTSFDAALTMAALVAGAAAAFTVDDPADETLAASPTSLSRRRALRGSAIALGLILLAGLLVGTSLLLGDVGWGALGRRAAELAATAGLAAAVASAVQRRGGAAAAHTGAVGGVLGVLLVAALADRLLPALPTLLDSPHHARWWLVAGSAAAAAAWGGRDPAR